MQRPRRLIALDSECLDPPIPLAVKAYSKSGIAVRCGVRGDDAGAGLMPPFLQAREASVKSGAAWRLRDHRETRGECSDVSTPAAVRVLSSRLSLSWHGGHV
ncbi:hypothetical protein GCM10010446_03900 [Streptomyces enissocaesilis]|uniref:Uncharacterized protein n=1 Tax=Streptomyces enissocaesilis TaxID=332589 RepID=A0ABP6J903_9ACTN